MTLRQAITADATAVFAVTDDFAESVTYKPHQDFGEATPSTRSIDAVVFRDPLAVLAEDGDDITPVFEVHVVNDDSAGISSTELNMGGDQISFPMRDGESAQYWTITRLLTQDHGMLVLECR